MGARIAVAVSLVFLAGASDGFADDLWKADFRAAAIAAQKAGKPLVIAVHAEWCKPCKDMERFTHRDARVVELLKREFVSVIVDGDKNPDLVKSWGVNGFPTELVVGTVGPIHKVVLERIDGKVGPEAYLKTLESALAKTGGARIDPAVRQAGGVARPAAPPKKAPSPPPMEEADPLPRKPAEGLLASLPPAPPTSKAGAAGVELPLAWDGHCVCSMVERGEMVKGKPEHEVVFAGKRYRFASAKKREAFEAEPPKFLPGEKGRCPVTFGDTGHWRDGDLRYPAIFAGRVFFLADESKRKKFLLNPEAYVDEQGRALRMAPPKDR